MGKRKNVDTEFLAVRTAHLMEVADKLLLRVEELTMEAEVTPAALKTLSETLKNIRDALKSSKDLQEQEARIEKMKKDTDREDEERGGVTVTLETPVEEFSK